MEYSYCPGYKNLLKCKDCQLCPDGSVCPTCETYKMISTHSTFSNISRSLIDTTISPKYYSNVVSGDTFCPGTTIQCSGCQCCPDSRVCPNCPTATSSSTCYYLCPGYGNLVQCKFCNQFCPDGSLCPGCNSPPPIVTATPTLLPIQTITSSPSFINPTVSPTFTSTLVPTTFRPTFAPTIIEFSKPPDDCPTTYIAVGVTSGVVAFTTISSIRQAFPNVLDPQEFLEKNLSDFITKIANIIVDTSDQWMVPIKLLLYIILAHVQLLLRTLMPVLYFLAVLAYGIIVLLLLSATSKNIYYVDYNMYRDSYYTVTPRTNKKNENRDDNTNNTGNSTNPRDSTMTSPKVDNSIISIEWMNQLAERLKEGSEKFQDFIEKICEYGNRPDNKH